MLKALKIIQQYVLLLLLATIVSGCESRTKDKKVTSTTTDTVAAQTVPEIMARKPIYKEFKPYVFYNRADTTYIRIVGNSKKMLKVWMVYYDNNKKDWTVKNWVGTGTKNTIIADTPFVIQKLDETLNKSSDIYMAYSEDEGKTWQGYEPNEAALSCKGNPALEKHAQLLVSNDFMNASHIPSLGILMQWKKPGMLKSNGITGRFDFTNYCDVLRELKR